MKLLVASYFLVCLLALDIVYALPKPTVISSVGSSVTQRNDILSKSRNLDNHCTIIGRHEPPPLMVIISSSAIQVIASCHLFLKSSNFFRFFKLADRMRSIRTNGASKNRDSWVFFLGFFGFFSPSKLLSIQIMTNYRE